MGSNLNFNALLGLVISIISFFIYIHVAYKQLGEVVRPRDWLSGLRWAILFSLLFAVFGLIPALTYQLFRTLGHDSAGLRNVANITANISRLGGAILLELVFNYKGRK